MHMQTYTGQYNHVVTEKLAREATKALEWLMDKAELYQEVDEPDYREKSWHFKGRLPAHMLRKIKDAIFALHMNGDQFARFEDGRRFSVYSFWLVRTDREIHRISVHTDKGNGTLVNVYVTHTHDFSEEAVTA